MTPAEIVQFGGPCRGAVMQHWPITPSVKHDCRLNDAHGVIAQSMEALDAAMTDRALFVQRQAR